MFLHIIFVSLFFLLSYTNPYIISDPRYPFPLCNNNQLANQYGIVTIETDLLRERIALRFNFTSIPTYSCYLCDKMSPSYCGQTTLNLSLSTELTFNIIMIGTGQCDSFPLHSDLVSHGFDQGVDTFSLDTIGIVSSEVSCETPLKFIIMPFITVQSLPFDFLSMVQSNETMPCNTTAPLFDDFDCSVIGSQYSIITLETPNCVAMKPNINEQQQHPIVIHSPLYWYKYSLVSYSMSIGNDVLCGRDWFYWLQHSNLTMYCSTYASFYVKMKPWYQLALQTIAVSLSIRGINTTTSIMDGPLALAYDTLERSCQQRDTIQTDVNNTYFNDLYMQLSYQEEEEDNTSTVCQEIASLLHIDDMNQGFLPNYLSFYKQWYFHYFSSFILYTAGDMQTGVIAFLVFMALSSTLFVILVFIIPPWMVAVHCYRVIRKKKSEQSYNAVNYVNEL